MVIYRFRILALEGQHKGSNAPSIRTSVVDEEKIRPDHSVLSILHCFDTFGWMIGKASSL